MYPDIERLRNELPASKIDADTRNRVLALLKELEEFRIQRRLNELRDVGPMDFGKTV